MTNYGVYGHDAKSGSESMMTPFKIEKRGNLYYVVNTWEKETMSIGTSSKPDCEELLKSYNKSFLRKPKDSITFSEGG